jgi:hypothetical protein
MGLIKESVQENIELTKSWYNSSKAALEWYSNAYLDPKNESVLPMKIGDYFRAGKIYKFNYIAKYADEMPYYDSTPIVISLGRHKTQKGLVERGINLNYLPKDARINAVDSIYKIFENVINEQLKNKMSGNVYNQRGLPLNYKNIGRIVDILHLSFAVKNYIVGRKSSVGIISYNNWDKACMLETDNFVKQNQSKVHADYFEYINKKIRK